MALTFSASFQFLLVEIVPGPNLESCVLSLLTYCHIVPLLAFVLHRCWFQQALTLMKEKNEFFLTILTSHGSRGSTGSNAGSVSD